MTKHIAALLACAIPLSACSGSAPSSTASSPPPAITTAAAPAAPPLFTDLGTYHKAVTTSNAEAQKYFDQGLRLMYGFNHDEAERAFREAARLDPSLAMAWWGVAVAVGPNYNLPIDPDRNARALDAVAKAKALAAKASDVERGYIDAIATRYSADPKADRGTLDLTYGNAMKQLSAKYPADIDAAVLYAESLMDLKPWQLWNADGTPAIGTDEILKVLEGVLARDPNHPGANHYYIHAVEASPKPERAMQSAQTLKTLVPGAGHLVHMPAHIHMRIGDYQAAIDANAQAASVDAAYVAKTKAEGVYPMMYSTHNYMFLSSAANMLGQSAQAIDSANKAVAIIAPMAGHEPMVDAILPIGFLTLLRNEKWDDVLAAPKPAESTPLALAMWHYARGVTHALQAKADEARKDLAAFDLAAKKVAPDFVAGLSPAKDVLAVARAVLQARIASAAGNRPAAIAAWLRAVNLQDQLKYDEPADWYYPVRESLGAEYLRAKDYVKAETVFREELVKNPGNPRAMFGALEAMRAQGTTKDVADWTEKFNTAWKRADLKISIDKM